MEEQTSVEGPGPESGEQATPEKPARRRSRRPRRRKLASNIENTEEPAARPARRRRRSQSDETPPETGDAQADGADGGADESTEMATGGAERGRMDAGGGETGGVAPSVASEQAPSSDDGPTTSEADPSPETGERKPSRRRRRRKRKPRASEDGQAPDAPPPPDTHDEAADDDAEDPAPSEVLDALESLETTPGAESDDLPERPAFTEEPSEAPSRGRSRGRGRRGRGRTDMPPRIEPPTMDRVMLVNALQGEECRIGIIDRGRLEELYTERSSVQSHVGNIYKGRVTNVEPSIQAAFVDFGAIKNGFLHVSDVQPQYFPNHNGQDLEEVGRKISRRDRPPIQKCFRRGQEVIVQITKDGIGNKGPTLTTYLSLPGRFLVMMPGMRCLGVSRKIESDEMRRTMRDTLAALDPPADFGFIARTAGVGRTKTDLRRDLTYLQRLWKVVAQRTRDERAPCELYTESDLMIRTIRDVFNNEVKRIIVDDPVAAQRAREFLEVALPRSPDRVELYEDPLPLFHRYGIEDEIERMYQRQVLLLSGGSIVIDQTEALVAIDVNSGKYRDQDDPEQTALRINLEAAEEICRQLRLRDLGGVIINDFIDMRHDRNRRAVEKAVRDHMKLDRAKSKVSRISAFGIIEMTRQRMRPSLRRNIYEDCPHCDGAGQIKTAESTTLDIMRKLKVALADDRVRRVAVRVHAQVAADLLNRKRRDLVSLEDATEKQVVIETQNDFGLDRVDFVFYDYEDNELSFPNGMGPHSR